VKPKPKAVNKPSPHFIVHGLDKPGVFTTVSAKAEQGGLGIAQRIDFRMKVRFEMLERGLQRPTLAI
jgi:hypothetical protein